MTLGAGRKARTTDERSIPITQLKRTPLAADLLQLVATSLDDDKAENVVVVDLSGRTAIADYLLIASGTSQRHVSAMQKGGFRAVFDGAMHAVVFKPAGFHTVSCT